MQHLTSSLFPLQYGTYIQYRSVPVACIRGRADSVLITETNLANSQQTLHRLTSIRPAYHGSAVDELRTYRTVQMLDSVRILNSRYILLIAVLTMDKFCQ